MRRECSRHGNGLCTESAEHHTNTDWDNALRIDHLCAAQNKHRNGALSNDLCTESEHNTNTENRRALGSISQKQSTCNTARDNARSDAVRQQRSCPLAKQDVSVCLHCTVCTCKAARRLQSRHTGSQETVAGFPSQKSGSQTRLAFFVPCYRDYP